MSSELSSTIPATPTTTPKSPPTINERISLLIRASYPILYIVSYEEKRILEQLVKVRSMVIDADLEEKKRIVQDGPEANEERLKLYKEQGRPLIQWSSTTGFQQAAGTPDRTTDPLLALDSISKRKGGIFVFRDLHPYLTPGSGVYNPVVVRALRDVAVSFRGTSRTLILLSPVQSIPVELEKDVTLIDYPLPSAQELDERLLASENLMKEAHGPKCIDLSDQERRELMQKSVGLTYEEVANVWARALEDNHVLNRKDIAAINEEKRQVIQKSGLLEFYPSVETFDRVGGLNGLKQWLRERKDAFLGKPLRWNLPALKGILLVGIPGCGKSLSAKAVASEWQLPLVRLDVGRIFDPLLGKTEANFRKAIKIAEELAPVVLWIDEVEKGFPQSSGGGDSGTSVRVLGAFLSWMQEKTRPVFVVATANDIEKMPPELTRKGRFDEIFYVGLPNIQERVEIFKIHLKGVGLEFMPQSLDRLAALADKFTGAEIEQVIVNSLWALKPAEPSGNVNLPDEIQIVEMLEQVIAQFHPLVKRLEENKGYMEMYNRTRQYARPASGEDPIAIPEVTLDEAVSWRRGP